MSIEYYVKNLSIETLAELTDEMLKFRKNTKNKKINLILLKIIPAITSIAFVIALMNVFQFFPPFDAGTKNDGIFSAAKTYIVIKNQRYSTELTELELDSSNLTEADIEPLQYMVNLTKLSLFGNQIKDITPLANLTNLTWLSLTDNPISDISPLAGLTNLTHLYLLGNQISDISPLAGLTNLTQLDLLGNPVEDITPLTKLINLTFLGLSKTQINTVEIVEKLTNLEILNLGCNPTNPEQIKKIKEALPNVDIITVLAGEEPAKNAISPSSPDFWRVREMYERGYRESLEYTKFKDSSFNQRMIDLPKEENDFIYECLCAGDIEMICAIADDISGLHTYDADGRMMVALELEDGRRAEFEIKFE